jgi:hypothetical protein
LTTAVCVYAVDFVTHFDTCKGCSIEEGAVWFLCGV